VGPTQKTIAQRILLLMMMVTWHAHLLHYRARVGRTKKKRIAQRMANTGRENRETMTTSVTRMRRAMMTTSIAAHPLLG
jgi:hypothetical protein